MNTIFNLIKLNRGIFPQSYYIILLFFIFIFYINYSNIIKENFYNTEIVDGKIQFNDEIIINKLKIGNTYLRQDDEFIRVISDYNNKDSYKIGIAAKNIYVDDDIIIKGLGSIKSISSELSKIRNQLNQLNVNTVKKDRKYAIQSEKDEHYLSNQEGYRGKNKKLTQWETVFFREV